MDWTSLLKRNLERVAEGFNTNELAYLSLISKNEMVLRDELAWRLHQLLSSDQDVRVTREWQKFDLAIVQKNGPVVVVEAKSAFSFDFLKFQSFKFPLDPSKTNFPLKTVRDDISKLSKFGSEVKKYILVFVTHPYQLPKAGFVGVVKYLKDIRRKGVVQTSDLNLLFENFVSELGNVRLVSHGELAAGSAFGVDVSVFYWLIEL